jgi:hypothetical protein
MRTAGKCGLRKAHKLSQSLDAKPGQAFIEATNGSAAQNWRGAIVSLEVVAASTRQMWKPRMDSTVGGPVTFSPWQEGIGLYSPLFKATGTVDPDPSLSLDQCELGFVQTLISADLTAIYVTQDGRPFKKYQIGQKKLPIRDADDDKKESEPWRKKNAVIALSPSGRKEVKCEDRPRYVLDWKTKDGTGNLKSCDGDVLFSTWLVIQEKPTKTLTVLNYAIWTVNWECSFDFANEKATASAKAVGRMINQGEDEGPFKPITDGEIANNTITFRWEDLR